MNEWFDFILATAEKGSELYIAALKAKEEQKVNELRRQEELKQQKRVNAIIVIVVIFLLILILYKIL